MSRRSREPRAFRPPCHRASVPLAISQPDFPSRTGLAELRAADVATHHGQAAMTAVAHDLLVGDAIAVGRGHESSSQAMRRNRLETRRLDAGELGPPHDDEPDRLATERAGSERALPGYRPEH